MPLQIKAQTKTEDQHSADVNTLIYQDGKLYSGADDGKVIVWDKDLNKLNEVQAHPTTVYCLAAGNDTLYSCSNDGAIRSWELENLKEKIKILQVDEEVYRLAFADGVLYSSDEHGNVRSHKDNVVKGLYALLEPLRELIVQNNCIYTVRDLDVVITEVKGDKTFEVKATFDGRAPMCIIGDNLYFSDRNGRDIHVRNNSSSTNYKTICEIKNAHEMIINSLTGALVDGNTYLYSGAWDKVVKRWSIENESCKPVDMCNVEQVVNVMVTADKGVVYVGCGNGSIFRLDIS